MENDVVYYPENELPNKDDIIKQGNGKYSDPYFKNIDKSITGKETDCQKYQWTRIFGSEKIFEVAKNEDKFNIEQGELGDCYFIAYLHSLRENLPGIFFSLFKNCQPNEGYFEFYFYTKKPNGEIIRTVTFVDDFIPYSKIEKYEKIFSFPKFSRYFNREINQFLVGKYLLLEKAYAKYKGCYKNIEGSNSHDIFFLLSGVKCSELILSDFLYDYIDINEFNKEKKLTKKELSQMPSLKKEIIEKNKLNEKSKVEIFDKINNYLNENLVNLGTEDKSFYGIINEFGIYANHRYDLIKCEKNNGALFFYTWNPHGENPEKDEKKNKVNNNYSGFDDINKANEKGLKNGDIILNFDRFFLSFRRLLYHNKNEILKMFRKYNTINPFELLGYNKIFFYSIFGINYDFGITFLLIRTFQYKNKDIKIIMSDFLKEIGSNNEINKLDLLWFCYFWDKAQKEIINESEKIMEKKSKEKLNEEDIDKIKNILLKENENSNEFFKKFSKINIAFINNKLNEVKKEIEIIARKIAENHIEKQSFNPGNFFLPLDEDEEVVIRSSLAHKNLDIEYNNIRSGTKIILYDAHGGESQTFLKVDNHDGTYSFKKYGHAIDVRFSEIKCGTQIQLWEDNGTKAQKFYLKDRGDGYVSIHSAYDKNFCIDVQSSGTHNFNKIQLWEKNGTNAQKFKLIPTNKKEKDLRREEEEYRRRKKEKEEEERRRRKEDEHRKHIDDLARRVIRGDFGSGKRRENMLGGEFKEVQNRVNEMLGCSFRYKI